jgi:tetratricopeptide (TPR) repeat protein
LTDAVAEYQAARRSQPDFADAHYNLGVALARLPDRRADAIAELEQALRRSRP